MYRKEINYSTYCSQIKACTRASKNSNCRHPSGLVELLRKEVKRAESPDTLKLMETREGSCVFSFLQSLAFFMMMESPQKCLVYLGNLPSGNTALQRSHCVVILKIYCLICLELRGSLVAMSKIGSGMLNHPVPCNLHYVFCQVLLKEKKKRPQTSACPQSYSSDNR